MVFVLSLLLFYLYSPSHTHFLSLTLSFSLSLSCLELFPHIFNGCLPNQAFTAGNFRTPHRVRRRRAPFLAQLCTAPGSVELAKERGGGSDLGSVPTLQLGKSFPFPFFNNRKGEEATQKKKKKTQTVLVSVFLNSCLRIELDNQFWICAFLVLFCFILSCCLTAYSFFPLP